MRRNGRYRRAGSVLLSGALLLSQLLGFAAAPAVACDRSLNAEVLAHLGGTGIDKVVVSGSYAYAAGDGGLVVFDVSDPGHPAATAQLALAGNAEDIAVSGGSAYVAGDFGLEIVDISDPARPGIVGGADWGPMHGVAVYDATHVIASLGGEMKLIDVSDPTCLDYCIVASAPSGSEFYDVAVSGTKLFASYGAAPGAVNKVRMFDLTDPGNVTVLGTYSVPGMGVSVRSLVASGSLVFAAEAARGLEIVDFTAPGSPAQRGTFAVTGAGGYDVVKDGPLAYLAAGDGGLEILNVGDPSSPSLAGTIGGTCVTVAVGAGKAYVAANATLSIFGSDPALPATYGTVTLLPADAKDVCVAGGYEYVAAGADGLLKVSFDATAGAKVVGLAPGNDVSKVVVQGGYAYVADNFGSGDGLRVFDISGASPAEVEHAAVGKIQGMAVDGNRLYLALGTTGFMQIIDISNPLHVSSLGTFNAHSPVHAVAADGDRVYIGIDGGNIVSLDAADPAAITERARMGTYGDVMSLSIAGGLLYAGTTEKVYKCSAEDPADLFQIGAYYYFGKSVVAVKGAGNYAYAATDDGFYLVDFSDAANPYVAMDFGEGSMAMGGVDAIDDVVFLAARDAGFFALRVPVFRTSGTTRYDTAVEMSKANWPSATHVVLATGANYADAACAAPLAHALGGPLLLVQPGGVPANVLAEIQRLADGAGGLGNMHVVIAGSDKVVSAAVVQQLADLGVPNDAEHIERLGGWNRYDTARMIAHAFKLAIAPSTVTTAFVATGDNFPDALTCSGLAASMDAPVLLVRQSYAPTPTLAAIDDLGRPALIAVGSDKVISNDLYASLGCVDRLYGDSRYDTAKAVADYACDNGFTDSGVIVTTGDNFPDALVAGVVSAKHDSPILLVNSGVPGATSDFLSRHQGAIQSVTVVGSAKAISQSVEDQIVDQLVW